MTTVVKSRYIDGECYVRAKDIYPYIDELQKENFKLSAGACPFEDGTGLVGNDYGNPLCVKQEALQKIRTHTVDIYKEVSRVLPK